MAAYDQPILRCLAFICVARASKTHIQHMDYGSLSVGLLNGDVAQLTGHPLLDLLSQLPISVRVCSNIREAIWEKLVWNAPFNPLSVLYPGATTADLLNHEGSFARIRAIMQEVQRGAQVDGVHISDQFIEDKIRQTKAMRPYKTSMCLDAGAGRAIEIEAILGNFLAFCSEHSVPVPVSMALYDEIRARRD